MPRTGYAITRERMLHGMGTTYSFVPRRRGLRGLGQVDLTPPDIGLGPIAPPPSLAPPTPGPTVPPGFYAMTPPFVPSVQGPLAPPPNIFPAVPTAPGFQLVFPSQGSTAYAAAQPVSWINQSTAGIPNMYLAIGAVGFVLLAAGAGGSRRRR